MDAALEKTELTEEEYLFYSAADEKKELGCIGHLRGDFGKSGNEFNCTWFEHQNGEKNDGYFQTMFDMLIDNLRADGNVLSGMKGMRDYCRERTDCKNELGYTEDCWGFRILTNEYALYLRCTPVHGDYNFYCYAYDRDMLFRHLAGQRGLPLYCYSYLPSTKEEIRIDFAQRGYCPCRQMASGRSAREMNREIGVTPEQAEAMACGSMFGWNVPGADPKNYEKKAKNKKEKEER